MGLKLAEEALRRGHRVTMVCGPVQEKMPDKARVVFVERASEMAQALRAHSKQKDAIVMAAAVADYEPLSSAKAKIRRGATMTLKLKATPDIIASLPRRRGQVVAGFALETSQVLKRARQKLNKKRLDLILAQDARAGKGPFGETALHAWILERGGKLASLGRLSKASVARQLLDKVEALCYVQRGLFKPLR